MVQVPNIYVIATLSGWVANEALRPCKLKGGANSSFKNNETAHTQMEKDCFFGTKTAVM